MYPKISNADFGMTAWEDMRFTGLAACACRRACVQAPRVRGFDPVRRTAFYVFRYASGEFLARQG